MQASHQLPSGVSISESAKLEDLASKIPTPDPSAPSDERAMACSELASTTTLPVSVESTQQLLPENMVSDLTMELVEKPMLSLKQIDFCSSACSAQRHRVVFRSRHEEYASSKFANFLKGAKWSPDGTCLLTNSEDNIMRLYETPVIDDATNESTIPPADPKTFTPVLKAPAGETIYDYCWFPLMRSSDPASSVFLSCSRDHPVHLWDAFTGQIRGNYAAYDHLDQLTAPISVSFDPSGAKIFAGFEKAIRVFDTSRPGRQCQVFSSAGKKPLGVKGIVSCFAFSPALSVLAAGSYSRELGLFSESDLTPVALLQGHSGGLTQLHFAAGGQLLLSGARKDNEILCWDVRNTGSILARFPRIVTTNQRIGFDIVQDRYVITPSHDGSLNVYSLESFTLTARIPNPSFVGEESLNWATMHPFEPLMATTSGERKFSLPPDLDRDDAQEQGGGRGDGPVPIDDNDHSREPVVYDNSRNAVMIWRLHTVDASR